jgi:two-component system NtrC family sensor kinase
MTTPGDPPVERPQDSALLHRPSFGIRTRIALSFLLCFVVTGSVTLASSLALRRIEQKLYFLEVADRYTSNIQQARRYEKNYFLYGTDLPLAHEHVRVARTALSGTAAEVERVVGPQAYHELLSHLDRYEELLSGLDGGPPRAGVPATRGAIEAELRVHGAKMVDVALGIAEAERQSVRRMLRLQKQMPIAALVVLLALIFYITNFLARQILAPLGRMVKATARIAEGDFSPVKPQRRYRDEFTGLALAINHMLLELNRRQEMLAESQKLRAIGTLTAGVAHELNNPINNISLTAEGLLEDYATLDDAARLDLCHDMLTQAERAKGVVRNLLDFARQRDVRVEPLDLGLLLGETVRLTGNQVRLAGAHLEVDIPDGLPAIRGDRQQISQVFVNLYLNALDAMPQGGTLRVRAGVAPDRPGFLRVDVEDTGIGIPESVLPYVFDPFYTTKGAKGTGLGLSVSYGIVTGHGGDITVQSQAGAGTTFSVFLPVAAHEDPQVAAVGAGVG